MTEGGVPWTRQDRAAGHEVVCGLKAHTDDRDGMRPEQAVESLDEVDGRIQREGLIRSLPVPFFKGASGQHHGGVNPDEIRGQLRNAPAGFHEAVFVVAGQPGHDLKTHFVAAIHEQADGAHRVVRGMATPRPLQHLRVHGLGSQLNGLNRKTGQDVERAPAHRVGAGGEPDALHLARAHEPGGLGQELPDAGFRDTQKIAPEKGDLGPPAAAAAELQEGRHLVSEAFGFWQGCRAAGDSRLVAVNATVGAAGMGDEHGHDEGADVFGIMRYGCRLQIAKGHAVLLSRVLQNKHQAVSQGVRRFGKRSIFIDM